MRIGRKKRPFYRIVATDSRKSRDGRYIEKIGHFDPISSDKNNALLIDREKALKWLKEGAILTDVAGRLLASEDIVLEKSPNKKKNRRKKRNNPIAEKIKLREEVKKKASKDEEKKVKTLSEEAKKIETLSERENIPPESKPSDTASEEKEFQTSDPSPQDHLNDPVESLTSEEETTSKEEKIAKKDPPQEEKTEEITIKEEKNGKLTR